LIDTLNAVLESSYDPPSLCFSCRPLVLTFQQIAFLVDSTREPTDRASPPFLDYALFCSFFAKHIAGPILRKDEILPQLKQLGRAVTAAGVMQDATRFLLGYVEKGRGCRQPCHVCLSRV
jgi:alginate O-acetyltransferase complex protein AlgI